MKRLTLPLAIVAGMVLGPIALLTAGATPTPHKFYVCKYVGQPGDFETLQTGQNPIFVDDNAIATYPNVQVGDDFADAQGHSKVVAGPYAKKLEVEPTCPTSPPPPPPCEQTEEGCPTETPPPPTPTTPPPPVLEPEAFIFSSCTDVYVRFVNGSGNAFITVDGVTTFPIPITENPQEVHLGPLPNGTVVVAGFNGYAERTLVVDNDDCVVTPPPPTETPEPNTPWTPTWTPNPQPIPTHPGVPGSGRLAETGASVAVPLAILAVLLTLGTVLLMADRRIRKNR